MFVYLYENVSFQTLSTGSLANCLFRFDPFQDVPCSTIEAAHARRLSPPDSMSTAGLWLNSC